MAAGFICRRRSLIGNSGSALIELFKFPDSVFEFPVRCLNIPAPLNRNFRKSSEVPEPSSGPIEAEIGRNSLYFP